MRTIIAIIALACSLPAAAQASDCATSFCRTKTFSVHRGSYGHAQVHHGVFAVNYGSQSSGQFWDDADLLAQAIQKGVGDALDARNIGTRVQAQGSVDLSKCLRCHGPQSKNENARASYEMPEDAVLDGPVAAQVLRGLRAGMSGPQYANLTEQQRQVWFDETTDALLSHFEKGD